MRDDDVLELKDPELSATERLYLPQIWDGVMCTVRHMFSLKQRDATVTNHSLSLGGGLVRNDINSRLEGEGGECTLNGLYVVRGSQHVDHHTVIDHAKPH